MEWQRFSRSQTLAGNGDVQKAGPAKFCYALCTEKRCLDGVVRNPEELGGLWCVVRCAVRQENAPAGTASAVVCDVQCVLDSNAGRGHNVGCFPR